MTRWSASRSSEYCSCDNSREPCLCGAVRSCRGSNESFDASGTFFSRASIRRGIPDAVCEVEHIPTTSSDERRKMPANAERHEDAYTLLAVSLDDRYGTTPDLAEGESPEDQIRRTRWSDHWTQAGLYICESVFFRLKLRVVAFFPGFRPPEFDLVVVQNRPKRLKADRRNDLFGNQIFAKLLKRPSLKRTAEKVRRALGGFGDEGSVVLGELCRPARTWFWLKRFKAVLIEILDNSPNMMFGIVNKFGDRRNLVALVRGEHHLSTSDFDTTCAATKDSLNLLAFVNAKVSGVQTHKKSLSMRNNIGSFLRVCLYSTILCIAQVLNMQKLNIIFWKRH